MKKRIIAIAAVGATTMIVLPALPANAAAKVGQSCKKLGVVQNGLVCTAKGKKRVYAAVPKAAPTTAAAPGAAATPAPAASGPAVVPGFDGKSINVTVLGNVSVNTAFPASVNFATGGKALFNGWKSYMSRINDAGGIAGKYKVNINFQETYYTPSEAVKAYAETKNNTVVYGMVYGTPLTQALEKSFGEDNLTGSPVSLDAAWVKSPVYLPIGATYQGQAINLLDWYNKDGGGAGKNVCALSLANNAYGNAGEEGFDFGAKALGIKVGGKFKTSTNAANAQQLKDANCDAVVITISGEAQTPGLLAETAKLGYFPLFLGLAPSFAVGTVVPANSAQFAKQLIVASDGAQWGVENSVGMKQHMADLRKYAPQEIGIPNPATEWGYAQAQSVAALLEKAVANGDLSKAGIRKALATLGTVDLGGLYPNWNYSDPAGRIAPNISNIYKVDISVRGGLDLLKPNFASSVVYK